MAPTYSEAANFEVIDGELNVILEPTHVNDPSRTEERYVRPGVLDKDSEWVFMNGYCFFLARAIRQRTGWPMAEVGWDSVGHGWISNHWGVEVPDERLLDIRGLHSELEFCRWPNGARLPHRGIRRYPEGREPRTTVTPEEETIFELLGETAEQYRANRVPDITDEQLDAFARALLEREGLQ